MAQVYSLLGALTLLAPLVVSTPSPASLDSDLTVLLDNNLQGANSPTADSGVIVLSPKSYEDAVASCQALSEDLWSPELLGSASIQPNLDYLVYEGKVAEDSIFWVAAGSNQTRALSASGKATTAQSDQELSVLCTQSAPFASSASTDTSTEWQVSVYSNNENLVGFRDRTSFRFYGIRYAPQPERFTYSVPYAGSNGSVSATSFGSECAQQGSNGTEDCLFLNIWTPYLPAEDSKSDKSALKPVMFWIHGGALIGGTGNDNTFDGGSAASRGDVVVVTINYRLSTLGYLALDDGVTNGNFGLGDQINALDWVKAHIQDFGGDADRITILGQSAGAGSVRAMMASPEAEGKFAGAIQMSNLGSTNLRETYSHFYPIEEAVKVIANPILDATNCTEAESQADCLRAVPASTLLSLSTTAPFFVVDGTYLTTENLTLTGPEAPYKLMIGYMREDAGPFLQFPTTTNETEYLQSSGYNISQPTLDELFPLPNGTNQTLNVYNVAARVGTDAMFRCDAEATAAAGLGSGRYSSIYMYEFERSYQLKDYPGTDVCQPPVTASHPNGDPSLPYLRCHSGELYLVFGNVAFQGLPERDGDDLAFEQLTLDSLTSFVRTYDPNPERGFLEARRYTNTSGELERAGPWRPATKGDLTLRALTWEPYQDGFRELQQCEAVGLPLTYWG